MFGFDVFDYWHWWVLAILLFILEVFSPAAFFIWIGLAAGIMAAMTKSCLTAIRAESPSRMMEKANEVLRVVRRGSDQCL